MILIAIWILTCGLAAAQNKVALVVGNGAYRNVPLLPNATNDATDIAASLERLGFTVDVLKDAGYDNLRRALIDFGSKASNAEMAVVYFGGHGMEIAGENWVVPVDAELRADTDVENEAIGLKSLVLAVSGAHTLGLVLLDACRNNPFESRMQHSTRTRAVSRGLAPIEPVDNVLVAYAAKDGTTANDGEGRNSPFASALLSHIETPGLEIDFLLRNVRDDVLAATGGKQQPFFYGSLSKEAVYLRTRSADAPADNPASAPAADEIAWPYVATTADADLVRRFIVQFPSSRHRGEADRRVALLEKAAATTDSTPQTPETPTVIGATTDQSAVARKFDQNTPQVEAAWSLVKTSADPATLRNFSDEFPSRQRKTVVAALNGSASSRGVLRQLRSDEMHTVLSDYGHFAQHPRYGEIWVPTVTPKGWHPYEPCQWVRSKRFDWTYLDRTPWGAIVHHYGRWTHDETLGWIWVPGVDFSPGWVVWRVGTQQVGWAPMPPVEDIQTISADRFETADFWTFMDKAVFTRACKALAVAPPATVRTLLQTTVFVRELRIVSGIPVFVLPFAIAGDPLDVDVVFDPWPASLAGQMAVDWSSLWALQASAAVCPPVAKAIKASLPSPKPVLVRVTPKPQPVQAAIKPKPTRPRRPVVSYDPPRQRPFAHVEPDQPIVAPPPRQPYFPVPLGRVFYPPGGFGLPGRVGIPGNGFPSGRLYGNGSPGGRLYPNRGQY